MNTKSRVEIMRTNFSASRMLRTDTPRPLYTAWAYADRVTMRTGTETKSSISLHVHMTNSQVCVGMGIPMGGMRIEIPSPRQPCQFAELFALACIQQRAQTCSRLSTTTSLMPFCIRLGNCIEEVSHWMSATASQAERG